MLTSITPLGQRGRGASWRRTVVAYVVASVLAGAAMGAVLGAVGGLVFEDGSASLRVAAALFGALALAGSALDLRGRVPAIRRQVDENWLGRYRDWVVGAGFGLQ